MNTLTTNMVYTPDQVAEILHLSKKSVYQLIDKGEIIAKKLGKVYRIPASSISFVFSGLDYDLYKAEQTDLENISFIHEHLNEVRKNGYEFKK
jgi:excisionase family DNA binding protein